mmetsp:Transcript_34723/g.101853  ORF Transcript_34723/g.101853 Transcript_34723/m.101853 type:complete len:214 (-) Transcript_34723:36-677(-)
MSRSVTGRSSRRCHGLRLERRVEPRQRQGRALHGEELIVQRAGVRDGRRERLLHLRRVFGRVTALDDDTHFEMTNFFSGTALEFNPLTEMPTCLNALTMDAGLVQIGHASQNKFVNVSLSSSLPTLSLHHRSTILLNVSCQLLNIWSRGWWMPVVCGGERYISHLFSFIQRATCRLSREECPSVRNATGKATPRATRSLCQNLSVARKLPPVW